ncbi:MAG TPA: hypothetical protein VN025_14725 [Candidatus Dormibacteraeota bacterium]|nr:hypothetical protein [Candidatus Dormibacteraeota bacterium]
MSEGAVNSEDHVSDEFIDVHDELANARITPFHWRLGAMDD